MDTFNCIFQSSLLVLSLVTGETDVICSLLLCDSLPVASMRDVCVSTRVFEHVHSRHPYVTGRGGGVATHIYKKGSTKCSTSCVSGSVYAAEVRHSAGWQTVLRCVTLYNAHEILACSVFCQSPLLTTFQTNTVLPPTICPTSVKALLLPIEQPPYHIQVECPTDPQD